MPDANQIVWRDEFDGPLALSDVTTPRSWRIHGVDDGGSPSRGYIDYAGSSWNVSPIQHPNNNPFSVANSILTITARRNPGLTDVNGAKWLGGYLVSEPASGLSWTESYTEWRMRLPNPARGMFPAIWLFSNMPLGNTSDHRGAEIDMLEVFGVGAGHPWSTSLHLKPSPGLDPSVGRSNLETTGWHRYGVERTPTALRFYRDGVQMYEVTGPNAEWFKGVPMGIRMNYAMDPNWDASLHATDTDPAPGTEPRMEVDYVRVYAAKPTYPTDLLSQGSDDPLKASQPVPTVPVVPIVVPAKPTPNDNWRLATIPTTGWTDSGPLVTGGTVAQNVGATNAPAGIPAAIFDGERWGEQTYTIPVATTGSVDVVLFFVERYAPAQKVGGRVFNIDVNGTATTSFDPWVIGGSKLGSVAQLTANVKPVAGKVVVRLAKGAAGDPMINALSVTATSVSTVPPAPAPAVPPVTSLPPMPAGGPIIAAGAPDAWARVVQTLLLAGGYPQSVNGGYGTTTTSNVQAFQTKNGLPVTGVVDGTTMLKLISKPA